MTLRYRDKNYSVTIKNRYECDKIIDCEIKFRSKASKQSFLNLYFNRPDFTHGDEAKIDNIVYNKCYFYNKDDSFTIIKCHIDKREGFDGRKS